MKRRTSLAVVFREAAVELCRDFKNTARVLLGDVVKWVQGVARTMASIRRDLEEVFGPRLTSVDIENLKRQAELDRIERAAAEQRQFVEEWQAAERERLEDEWALEEERMRAIRLRQDLCRCGSTLPATSTRSVGRGWRISAHRRARPVR
jgi:hypothetical protein